MRFASLGSGSEGNGLVVEVGDTRILIDCGFRVRDTVTRLGRLGVAPDSVTAIVVTHEHADHIAGVASFARRFRVPVWLTFGTLEMAGERFARLPKVYGFDSHDTFAVGMVEVRPFPVPHDAREPVQYVFSDGDARLGVATDLGCVTQHVVEKLSGCTALVLECNHDLDMLMTGPYPAVLKHRVAGRFGHLDNHCARDLVRSLDRSRLRHLIAAHLSKQNNRPELAAAALCEGAGCEAGWVGVATQEDGFAWRDA